jgi:predicted Zn-ribbon and HTH transcriptional regulator
MDFGTGGILTVILSLIILITFFVISYRLGRIADYLRTLVRYEERKPENQKQIKCEKCGKEFIVGVLLKGNYKCPECKNLVKV